MKEEQTPTDHIRSPLLACSFGTSATLRMWSSTVEYAIAWGGRAPTDDGVVDLVGLPALPPAMFLVIMRAVRILLMYYPRRRESWGRIPKEGEILRIAAGGYALLEVLVWVAAAIYGVPRTADLVSTIMSPLAMLIALAAAAWVGSELRKVDDMCSVGRETIYMEVFLVGSGCIFPRRMGARTMRRVVVNLAPSGRVASQASGGLDGKLDDILGFPPLRSAFGEFCRKALCYESFSFLLDVADFKHAALVVLDPSEKDTAAGEDFTKYLAIVKEYIESNARSEVNIDDDAKHEALRYTEPHDYISLSLDQRSEIFLLAEREIIQLLVDNLLVKFKASAPYKELVQDEELQEK
eukprot:g8701.t1